MNENGQLDTKIDNRHSSAVNTISLLDIWNALSRHRSFIFKVFLASIVVGIVLAFVIPRKYVYMTAVEIGTRLINEGVLPIESPDMVLARIRESYIPQVLYEFFDEDETEKAKATRLGARVPKNSHLIIIEGVGTVKQAEQRKAMIFSVLDKLAADHERIYASHRKELEVRHNYATRTMDALRDDAKIFQFELERRQAVSKLLETEIADLSKLVDETERNRDKAATQVKNDAETMTLLLLDSEIRAGRRRLAELKERLYVHIPSEVDSLRKKLADNLRDQQNVENELAKLELEMKYFRATRAIVEPMRSLEPRGLSRAVIALLTVLLGLFLATIVVLVKEYMGKIRSEPHVKESSADVSSKTDDRAAPVAS